MDGVFSIRDEFIDELITIGRHNPKLVVVDPDVGSATRTWKFGQELPKQFFECGIAEQNAFGMSVGLALGGLTVVTATFAVFASMRAAEMIRTGICYQNLNVKIIGGYAGLSNGKDGATHQSIEDIAIMRSFPNMTVVTVSDPVMAKKIAKTAVAHKGPVYVRMEYENLPKLYNENFQFEFGKSYIVKPGTDITILTMGTALHRAMEAAKSLSEMDINAEVIDVATIKPLDEETIMKSVKKTGILITLEDHNLYGGLWSAVAEALLKIGTHALCLPLGICDLFTESGKTAELRADYGLNAKTVIQTAIKAIDKIKQNGGENDGMV